MELEEAETLTTQVVVKEQLKLVQIHETLVYDDTNSISNASVEAKSFININWLSTNLNLNSLRFYVPSDPNCIHKPQSTNPNIEYVRPSTSYLYSKKFE